MRAIDRTTKQFLETIRDALPDASIQVSRSKRPHGRSNYVYIRPDPRAGQVLKVRISDHPVGMRRALHGEEDLFIDHRAPPSSWAVWVGDLKARLSAPAASSIAIRHADRSPACP